MSHFRGKMQQYNSANDRFNIMAIDALIFNRPSRTIQDMKKHPLTYTTPRNGAIVYSTNPPPTPPPYCPPISLSDIATYNSGEGYWELNTNTNILACQTLTIRVGEELQINSGDSTLTLINNGIIINNGTITNNSGIIENNFLIENFYIIINNSSFLNTNGEVINSGTITNNYLINSSGIINNYDKINNNLAIDNYGTVNNNNTIDNSGTISNNSGKINNNDGGTITNHASIVNNNDGTITNDGTINNYSGTITNNASIVNNNDGTITNDDIIVNSLTIENYGSISNTKTFSSDGTFTNYGNGTIKIYTSNGVLTNQFDFFNDPDGNIYVYNNGTLNVDEGSFQNDGNVYTGDPNTCGSGTVTGVLSPNTVIPNICPPAQA